MSAPKPKINNPATAAPVQPVADELRIGGEADLNQREIGAARLRLQAGGQGSENATERASLAAMRVGSRTGSRTGSSAGKSSANRGSTSAFSVFGKGIPRIK